MKHRRGRALRRRYGRTNAANPRYEIYAVYPKMRGEGFSKRRYLSGRAQDAQEALTELWRVQHSRGPAERQTYIVLDKGAKRGRLAPIITESELRERAGMR
jgi:hypothetical protein